MGIKLVTENRKARHNYEILETIEAGLVLKGSEVKSLRQGACSLSEAYVALRGDEAYLQNSHIPVYKSGGYTNHEPERLRKLLLHRAELHQIHVAMSEKGLSCVPLKVYFKNGYVKLLVGLGRSKKKYDKRDSIKKRDIEKSLRQTLKKNRR